MTSVKMPTPLSYEAGHGVPPLVRRVADYAMSREFGEYNTGWEDVLVPYGLLLVGRDLGDEASLRWAREWMDYQLGVPIGRPDESVYQHLAAGDGRRGILLASYCGEWGVGSLMGADADAHNPAWQHAIREVADHILAPPVVGPDGVIGHATRVPVPWVDTLYYTSSPLALAYAATGDTRYAEEAIRQCLLHAKHLRDERTGCFFHEAEFDGRRSGWFWSRGNGWVIMTFADVLRHCPPETPGYDEVMRMYRSIVDGLLRMQHPCGLWRIVPENDEAHLETSGSIMIATGIAVGVAEGWIDETQGEYVLRTWNEIRSWVDADGRLLGCQTPAGVGGWETHKRSFMGERTYGTGSLLRFAAELRRAHLI